MFQIQTVLQNYVRILCCIRVSFPEFIIIIIYLFPLSVEMFFAMNQF